MWATVLCVGAWLLYKAQESIAHLVSVTQQRKFIDSELEPLFVFSTGVTFLLEMGGWSSYVGPVVILGSTGCIFHLRQSSYAKSDRLGKAFANFSKPSERNYIAGVDQSTRSGWANNPKLLQRLPPWITTRRLTCMSLVEIGTCFTLVYYLPDLAGLWLSLLMIAHYVTDALDGAVGRFRKEGYVQWGYYADHCFDALYEVSCVAVVCIMIGTESWLSTLLLPAMGLVVWQFHERELVRFQGKATNYTNLIGGLPLHYSEWAGAALALATWLFAWSWTSVGSVLGACLFGTLIKLSEGK